MPNALVSYGSNNPYKDFDLYGGERALLQGTKNRDYETRIAALTRAGDPGAGALQRERDTWYGGERDAWMKKFQGGDAPAGGTPAVGAPMPAVAPVGGPPSPAAGFPTVNRMGGGGGGGGGGMYGAPAAAAAAPVPSTAALPAAAAPPAAAPSVNRPANALAGGQFAPGAAVAPRGFGAVKPRGVQTSMGAAGMR